MIRPLGTPTPTVPTTRQDPHWDLAGRLMDSVSLGSGDHVLLRENLATCLTQVVDAEGARNLESTSREELLDRLRESPWATERWIHKVERDLSHPYGDQETWQHVGDLEHELRQVLGEVNPQGHPCKVYVMGSLMRGRLGARSDLDVVLETDSSEVLEAARGRGEREDGVSLVPVEASEPGFNRFLRMMTGPAREVDPHAPEGFLKNLYAERLARKGLRVEEAAQGRVTVDRVEAPPRQRESARWFEAAVSKAWREDLTPEQKQARVHGAGSLLMKAVHLGGSAVGTLAGGALGPAIYAGMGLLVTQD